MFSNNYVECVQKFVYVYLFFLENIFLSNNKLLFF